MKVPFYNPQISFEENYEKGPFGKFADGKKVKEILSPPKFDFLGHKVNLPFGIPAGTLLNSRFIKAAFEKGFDIAVYKTVRSGYYPCHPFPNVLSVHINGPLTIERAKEAVVADNNYTVPLSVTNSFGVPSFEPDIWQEEVNKSVSFEGLGQVLVLSFMGTAKKNQTEKEFIDDFKLTAKLANETKAKILEVNLSCPNIGNEGLVCYNLEISKKIIRKIRNEIGNKPLLLKVGYYQNEKDLVKFSEIANEYADGVSVINTIQSTIVDRYGKQALPGGAARLKSGIGGAAIKWAGVDMVKRLKIIKKKYGYKFLINGVGGVMNVNDYFDYKKAGAFSVMSSTGSMWNLDMAIEIKKTVKKSMG